MRRTRLVPVALCLMCMMLAGCFEIEEKVSILPTGEAMIQFLLRLPITGKEEPSSQESPKQAVEELSKQLTGFSSVSLNATSPFGQTIVTVTAKAPSFAALAPFYVPLTKKKEGDTSKDALDALTPNSFYQMKRKGDRLMITRTFTPPPQKKKKMTEEEKNAAAFMGMFGGAFMRFELNIPGKVISSNAEEVSGSRLTWVIPMDYLQKNKVTLKAEIEATPELMQVLGK